MYKAQSAVVNTLETRKMKECLLEGFRSSDSQEEEKTDESEYLPSEEEFKQNLEEVMGDNDCKHMAKGKEMERRLFVSESTQLMDFVEQINQTSKCSTANCNGKCRLSIFPIFTTVKVGNTSSANCGLCSLL